MTTNQPTRTDWEDFTLRALDFFFNGCGLMTAAGSVEVTEDGDHPRRLIVTVYPDADATPTERTRLFVTVTEDV